MFSYWSKIVSLREKLPFSLLQAHHEILGVSLLYFCLWFFFCWAIENFLCLVPPLTPRFLLFFFVLMFEWGTQCCIKRPMIERFVRVMAVSQALVHEFIRVPSLWIECFIKVLLNFGLWGREQTLSFSILLFVIGTAFYELKVNSI